MRNCENNLIRKFDFRLRDSKKICKFEINRFYMPTIIIDTKNKKQEKIIHAFLDSIEVNYYTEAQEEQALYNAMKKREKTGLLSIGKKKAFINSLKNGK